MARKPPPPKASRSLSSSEKLAAIARLEARIMELSDLSVGELTRGDDPTVTGLKGRIRSTLANIYGQTVSNPIGYKSPRITMRSAT
jgi:hypothetical protein